MRRRVATTLTAPDDLVAAFTAEATRGAAVWFPELNAQRLRIRFLTATARARCFLYRVELEDQRVRREVMIKVRHSEPGLRMLDRFEDRPMLTPERTMSDLDTAKREYDGLQIIQAALERDNGQRFEALRPLAWLPEQRAIVMNVVQQPLLSDVLLETSRFNARPNPPMPEATWRNVGVWLRIFHDVERGSKLPQRTTSRAEVAELYQEFAEFLSSRPLFVSSFTAALKRSAVELTEVALPTSMPLSTGHGDFVATNIFLGFAGKLTVFDPLPIWRVPEYQDLSTLLVGIRLLPLQAATQGTALSSRDLAAYEAAALRGYYGSDSLPLEALRAYQLLVLLDKWSAMVSKRRQHGSLKPHLHEARVQVASRHYHREARRLHSLLTQHEVQRY